MKLNKCAICPPFIQDSEYKIVYKTNLYGLHSLPLQRGKFCCGSGSSQKIEADKNSTPSTLLEDRVALVRVACCIVAAEE